ncbi:MAG: hypothetical protein MJ053_01455 [Elusimicrobiaceae bacterium]|nr:hypothetical protein [Elusimicrobiaceae bacterium]
MPEEKKKESFTFSDKIKNSKQPAAKSFANRISSKIGNDGRPRQTLFERTKRDAPFFIAALVALLLLPFLYKYSGSVNDDEGIVTPGYEDAIVNPDRSGFDFTDSGEGQISQLAGRDSMDLIVGFGKHRASEEEEDNFQDLYRSGLSEDNTSKKASYARNDMNEEINNTNIYRYRKQAAPQTRKAFRRAATKLGTLKGAGLTGRGGGRLGVGNFGGSLKNAAQKVRGETPRTSPKPVSLQPLTAAGKPFRSYFGQGAAAEARRSKDAMSKANPLQALMDAQMREVEPVKIGGITGGDFGGPGGGNGKLERNFAFNGKEPWWWDMMKTRSQKRWEMWFNLKKKLYENLWDAGLKLLSCGLFGSDDFEVDHFLGSGGGVSTAATCCGKKESWFHKKDEIDTIKEIGFEKFCSGSTLKEIKERYHLSCGSREYKAGNSSEARVGFFGQRWQCIGGVAGRYTSGELALDANCDAMVNGFYQVTPSGQARKWNTYIYVVARNYLPQNSKAKLKDDTPRGYLCTGENDGLKIGGVKSAGVGAYGYNKQYGDGKNDTTTTSGKEKTRTTARTGNRRENAATADMYNLDREDVSNACVIYVQRGDTFNWKNFETTLIEQFKKSLKKQGVETRLEEEARDAFNQLDLMFIDAFSAKSPISGNDDFVGNLPLLFWRFEDAYIRHKNVDESLIGKVNVDNRRYRILGSDYITADEKCYFNDIVRLNCTDVDAPEGEAVIPTATVTFSQRYKGGQELNLEEEKGKIKVEAAYYPFNADKNTHVISQVVSSSSEDKDKRQLTYSFTDPIRHEIEVKSSDENGTTYYSLTGYVNWTVTRAGQVVGTKRCRINLSGGGVSSSVESKECTDMNQSEACCREIGGDDYVWRKGKCEPKETSQSAYTAHTAFAPYIKWVPKDPAGRHPVTGTPTASTFTPAIVSEYNPTSGHDGCQELFGYPMDSTKATAFVNQVKEAYNQIHKDVPIVFDKAYPQDGEFIDALNVAASLGINTVPAAAVCELGRDFVRMSYDPHAGNLNTVGASGLKGAERIFHNDLGAYLVYVHEDSILYPQSHLELERQTICDWRFQPKGYHQAGCPDNGPKMAPRYMYNNYNGVIGARVQPITRYKESLVPTQAKATYPLAALVGDKTFPHNCGNCKAMSGTDYVKKYNSTDGFAGLLRDHTTPAGSGRACEEFAGERTMSVADALKYVEAVCSAGLDYKPYGTGASAYRAGQSPSLGGGGPGHDVVTE